MTAPVEITSGLERRISIEIPANDIDTEVNRRIDELMPKAKIDGFRPGKVPKNVVKTQFGKGILQEVVEKLTQQLLFKAIADNKLEPIDLPEVEFTSEIEEGKAVTYVATFEIGPDIQFTNLASITIDKPVVTVSEKEIDDMLEKLRKQYAEWHKVDRVAKEGDQVTIDFVGSIDGEKFAGGEANNFKIEIGAKRMIPGFEEGLIGLKAGDEKDLNVHFPENYHAKDLAGKAAVFASKVHEVEEPKLPELNDAFAEKLGEKEGGITALRARVKERLQNELEKTIKMKLRENLFERLIETFQIELPKRLLQKEIHKMIHQVQGHEHVDHDHHHHDHSHDDNLPMDEIEKQAKKQIALQLLFSAYIKQNDIKLDDERVRQEILKFSQNYENPEEIARWYLSQERLLNEMKSRVFEEQVLDDLLSKVTVNEKSQSYDETMKEEEL